MIKNHDIFSETNPAFCSFVLRAFVQGFYSASKRNPEYLLLFTVLPITISAEFNHTFEGTNINTGLSVWIHRNPRILIQLAGNIEPTLPITSDAIAFGCISKILSLEENMNVGLGAIKPKENLDVFKKSQRLGHWMAKSGSPRTIFNVLGVSL